MLPKTKLTYNPWFLLPFLVWMIAGGFLLAGYSAQQLFSAVNTRNTPFLDVFMHWATEMGDGTFISLLLLCVFALPPFRNRWFFIATVACNAVPALLIQVLKNIYSAPRPQTVFKGEPWLHFSPSWGEPLYHNSFPSGHSAGAFSLFCFLSLLLPRKYSYFALVFFMLALLVGYSRLYLTAHFFRDVYVGSMVGTIATMALYRLIREVHGRFFRTPDSLPSTKDTIA